MELENMKKAYVKPTMESEEFVPSKYVAVCTGATYDAWCNKDGYIFNDYNGNGYIDSEDTFIYVNEACNEHYRSEIKPEFNALAFNEYQLDIDYGWGGIRSATVKDRYKSSGTPGFVYRRQHFSTRFNTTPHYVS